MFIYIKYTHINAHVKNQASDVMFKCIQYNLTVMLMLYIEFCHHL